MAEDRLYGSSQRDYQNDQLNGLRESFGVRGKLTTEQCRRRAKTQRYKSDHELGLGGGRGRLSIPLVHWQYLVRLTVLHKKFISICGIILATRGTDRNNEINGLTHNVSVKVPCNGHVEVLVEI